jgi:hypothetical protein
MSHRRSCPRARRQKITPEDRQTRSDTVSSRAGNSAEAATQVIVKIIIFARKLWILDMDTATTGVTTGVAGDVSIGGRLSCRSKETKKPIDARLNLSP